MTILSQFVLRWVLATRWMLEGTMMVHQTILATVRLLELLSSEAMHQVKKLATTKPADRRYSE